MLSRLAATGLEDVYFDHRYLALYLGEDGAAEAFVFEDGRDLLFFAYIRRPVPDAPQGRRLYDFETAYGYGGPLATTRDAGFLGEAWSHFAEHCRATGLVAGFVRFHPLLDSEAFAAGSGIVEVDRRETVKLTLSRALDEVRGEFSRDNREKLRKGLRRGVVVRRCEGRHALLTFAALYRQRMGELEAQESYFFDDAYFLGIEGLGPGRHAVYLAEFEDEAIGGALVLLSPRFAHLHLSASRRDRFDLAPNNMLRWGVIEDLVGSSHELLHFGGGPTSDPDDGVLAFKRRFSPERAAAVFGRYVADEATYGALRAAWAARHPDKVARFGHFALCYRY